MLIDSHVNLHAPQFAEDQGAVIDRARAAGIRLMVNISDKFRGGEGAARFGLLMERLSARVHEAATTAALSGSDPALDAWAAAWRRLQAIPREAEALNLDRADAFWSAMAELRNAARARPFGA